MWSWLEEHGFGSELQDVRERRDGGFSVDVAISVQIKCRIHKRGGEVSVEGQEPRLRHPT